MSRLIDADALIDKLKKDEDINVIADIMISRVNNEPTAKDTDSEMALHITIAALEKQIAKEPIDRCMFKECPVCHNVEIENCRYCPDCGQKLEV